MPIPGNLLTTAMAVMPHKNVERAIDLALSLDIPFWPQLPRLSYYEDMYVQASEHFPGILVDIPKRTLRFSTEQFVQEFDNVMSHFDDADYFDTSPEYSAVYNRFLELQLSGRPAIRGQLEGPISFGLNILDENGRPIIFNDTIRPLMFDILARKAGVQLKRLKGKNANAFMFIDEPGMQFLFSGMTGYGDTAAKGDLEAFFSKIEKPRGIHLCGNPDWDFLLGLDLDVLSLDVYSNGEIFSSYAQSIRKFLDRGGRIVWGIVPTNFEPFEKENTTSLMQRLDFIWSSLSRRGIDRHFLISRSLLSPATCCLINPDGEETVERAFGVLRQLAIEFREHLT